MNGDGIGTENEFVGFEPLSANFVFTPNQFLDVVIPNYSRPVVRLVAYIMHQTLRWLDENGCPVNQDISVSFNTLIKQAGISRGSIAKAIETAVDANLIECKSKGVQKTQSHSGKTAVYSLRWDQTGNYAKSPDAFEGFFVGEGNRSPIPHSFFSHVVATDPLAVTKVVATVLRHTVGYQNQFGGGRRFDAPLSFSRIQQYANISSSTSLASAIQESIASNYINRIRAGVFSSDPSQQRATIYAINWLNQPTIRKNGSETVAGDRYKNRRSVSVQDPNQHAYKTSCSMRSKNDPADRFNKPSNIKKPEKTNNKQNKKFVVDEKSVSLLKSVGFEVNSAINIAELTTTEIIENQIRWLDHRTPSKNPLGLLRKSIAENWSEPENYRIRSETAQRRQREYQKDAVDLNEQGQRLRARKNWNAEWFNKPESTREACKNAAIQIETNLIVEAYLKKKSINDTPPPAFLEEFKKQVAANSETDSDPRESIA